MAIIADGSIDIYTFLEGQAFIIDKLEKGSIINYNSFLLKDKMLVRAKASSTLTLYCL